MDNTNKNILTEATTDDGSVGTPAGSIDYSNSKILIENTSTFGYRLYLEYAKEVLRTKASQSLKAKVLAATTSLILLAIILSGMILFLNPEGLLFIAAQKGLLYVAAFIVIVPAGLALAILMLFQGFFPHVFLASRFRLKHAHHFFADATGNLNKTVLVKVRFFADGITYDRGGNVEELDWKSVVEIAESKHFYFLLLPGEIIDVHNAYIRSGIILKKDGFTKGSWEELQGYLAQYCSEGLCATG